MTELTQTDSDVEQFNLRTRLHYVAWVQALIATTGSLFFSEVLGFIPCILCWYQRILMYPLVLILGTGILLRDPRVRNYGLPLSLLGWVIGLYHNLLYYGAIPEEWHICTSGVPCETRWIEWLGFVGIPLLSFSAFTVITLALLWFKPNADDDDQVATSAVERPSSTIKVFSGLLILIYVVTIAVGGLSRVTADAESTNTFGPSSSARPTATPLQTAVPEGATNYTSEQIAQGQQVFSQSCAACHGQNAQGVPNLGLPLVGSPFVLSYSDSELVDFIITGRLPSDPQNQTGVTMPGKGGNPALTEDQILAVVAYLRSLNT